MKPTLSLIANTKHNPFFSKLVFYCLFIDKSALMSFPGCCCFSPSPIKSVSVEIDGKVVEAEISNVEGPLFVCKWNPDDYATGIHTLTVKG